MIVIAGEALVDLVIEPDGAVTAALGGAPYNAARAAARLAAPVEFVGVLSTDRFGGMLADQLAADGVGVRHAPRCELPTTLAAAELDETGGADYRFYFEGTSAPSLSVEQVARLGVAADVVFTGGLALVLEPMADAVVALVESAPESSMVVVDLNCRPHVIDDRDAYLARLGRVLARVDVVKASDEDLEYLAPGEPHEETARSLTEHGVAAVIVTHGALSTNVVLRHGNVLVATGFGGGTVVDTIGAGDTFCGAFLAAWTSAGRDRSDFRGRDASTHLGAAVSAAHGAATIVVTRRGADPPWLDQLPDGWPL